MEICFSPVSIPPSGRLLPPPVLVRTPLRHGRPPAGIVSCHCGMECVGRGLHLPASLSRDCKCQQCEQLVFRLGPPPTSHSPPLSLPLSPTPPSSLPCLSPPPSAPRSHKPVGLSLLFVTTSEAVKLHGLEDSLSLEFQEMPIDVSCDSVNGVFALLSSRVFGERR